MSSARPSSTKKIIYFIRHAESRANVDIHTTNQIYGQSVSVELTDNGRNQAKALGEYLREQNTQFTHVYSSTAVRAQSTAEICLSAMGDTVSRIEKDPRLLEQDFGGWSGRLNVSKLKMHHDGLIPLSRAEVQALIIDNSSHVPDDDILGESNAMVAARMLEWVHEMLNEVISPDGDAHIACFSHGHAMRYLLIQLLNLDKRTAVNHELYPCDNASITELSCTGSEIEVTQRNITP